MSDWRQAGPVSSEAEEKSDAAEETDDSDTSSACDEDGCAAPPSHAECYTGYFEKQREARCAIHAQAL